jgi:hypothetical protein
MKKSKSWISVHGVPLSSQACLQYSDKLVVVQCFYLLIGEIRAVVTDLLAETADQWHKLTYCASNICRYVFLPFWQTSSAAALLRAVLLLDFTMNIPRDVMRLVRASSKC